MLDTILLYISHPKAVKYISQVRDWIDKGQIGRYVLMYFYSSFILYNVFFVVVCFGFLYPSTSFLRVIDVCSTLINIYFAPMKLVFILIKGLILGVKILFTPIV